MGVTSNGFKSDRDAEWLREHGKRYLSHKNDSSRIAFSSFQDRNNKKLYFFSYILDSHFFMESNYNGISLSMQFQLASISYIDDPII